MSDNAPIRESAIRDTVATLVGSRLTVVGSLGMLLAALMLGASLVGAYPISLADMLGAIGRRLSAAPVQGQIDTVLFEVRLPRVLAAALLGAAIAGAGAAYQTLFRNPLVSPDILGVSTGAGLGAVLGIFLSLPVVGIQLFWLLGSLSAIRRAEVWAVVPLVLLGLVPLVLLRWRINVLSLGDEEAKALGVEAGRLRLLVVAAATLMTASVVAISGVIGWVGLVIPHIARMIVGPSFDRLLPTAMLLGASYLLLVDTLARTMARIEVPIGILTAMIGAPFFLWLLAKGREGWS